MYLVPNTSSTGPDYMVYVGVELTVVLNASDCVIVVLAWLSPEF